MRPTGLYDEDDKEIFTGDLVQQGRSVFKVYWDDTNECFRIRQYGTGHRFHLGPVEDMRIIKFGD